MNNHPTKPATHGQRNAKLDIPLPVSGREDHLPNATGAEPLKNVVPKIASAAGAQRVLAFQQPIAQSLLRTRGRESNIALDHAN